MAVTFKPDSLAGLLDTIIDAEKTAEPVSPPRHYTEKVLPTYTEPCKKCGGSGRFVRGYFSARCFACNGAGRKTFKTSPEARAKNRANAADRRAELEQVGVDAFKAAHPEAWAWIEANPNFEFARNMGNAVRRFGSLTENQMNAVNRCIQRATERAAAATERVNAAPVVEVAKLNEAFQRASNAGLRKLKLRLDTFQFTPAAAHGRNPGAIYVKENGAYLGKVVDGKFFKVRECSDETRDRVVAAAADPEAAAVAYGKKFGTCSCCGRELSDPESVAKGIGPICASKWF